MMHLKGTISWEGLCYSFGYLVAMVTTDVLKMYPNSHDYFHYCSFHAIENTNICKTLFWVLHIGLGIHSLPLPWRYWLTHWVTTIKHPPSPIHHCFEVTKAWVG